VDKVPVGLGSTHDMVSHPGHRGPLVACLSTGWRAMHLTWNIQGLAEIAAREGHMSQGLSICLPHYLEVGYSWGLLSVVVKFCWVQFTLIGSNMVQLGVFWSY
jgi:hypothetical protein